MESKRKTIFIFYIFKKKVYILRVVSKKESILAIQTHIISSLHVIIYKLSSLVNVLHGRPSAIVSNKSLYNNYPVSGANKACEEYSIYIHGKFIIYFWNLLVGK